MRGNRRSNTGKLEQSCGAVLIVGHEGRGGSRCPVSEVIGVGILQLRLRSLENDQFHAAASCARSRASDSSKSTASISPRS